MGEAALAKALEQIVAEYRRAADKFPAFNSFHEGYAVLLEEVDELWDEVRKKEPTTDTIRKEAVQVAAMAIRIIAELT